MSLLSVTESRIGKNLACLARENPFLPGRLAAEKAVLEDDLEDPQPVWSTTEPVPGETANTARISDVADRWSRGVRSKLLEGSPASREELGLYQDVIAYILYDRHRKPMRQAVAAMDAGNTPDWREIHTSFRSEAEFFLDLPGIELPTGHSRNHLFAFCFQVCRAFHHIFRLLPGRSAPLRRLQASVWRALFSHDLRRYLLSLYTRLPSVRILLTGAPGTSRAAAARAIGLSGYLPFDPKAGRFVTDPQARFRISNLGGLPDTAAMSELVGHQKDAFPGALDNRAGRIEAAGQWGAVFLRNVEELPPAVQTRLAVVLDEGSFRRLGGSRRHEIAARIIASTTRDPGGAVTEGRLRSDLHALLAENVIRTPTLRERLADEPGELDDLVRTLAARAAPDQAVALAREVLAFIEQDLGNDYPWPGNLRELGQCVRSVLVTGTYRPTPTSGGSDLDDALRESGMTAEAVARRHVTVVYAEAGTYEETARRLELDRRTVKKRVDEAHLARLRSGAG